MPTKTRSGHFLVMEFVDGQDLASLVAEAGAARRCRGGRLHPAGGARAGVRPRSGDHPSRHQARQPAARRPRRRQGDRPGPGTLQQPRADCGDRHAAASPRRAGYWAPWTTCRPSRPSTATSIDHRADIYSLGATLYFLLLGRPPYQGQTLMATLLKHRRGPDPFAGGGPQGRAGRARRGLSPHDGEGTRRSLPDDEPKSCVRWKPCAAVRSAIAPPAPPRRCGPPGPGRSLPSTQRRPSNDGHERDGNRTRRSSSSHRPPPRALP